MNAEPHSKRSAPRATLGFRLRFLAALFTAADGALTRSRRDADERASEDDIARVWPAHSRLTRGYEEP